MTNFQRIVASKFLSNLYFAIPITTFFLYAKGLSFTQIMLLESVFLLADLLFEIPTGIIGDKVGRKWSIACGQAIVLLSWIPWFMSDSFGMFAVFYFICGIGAAFQSGSDQALIYEDLKERGKESLMQVYIGRYLAAATLGFAAAGLMGGFIAVQHDMSVFYWLYAMTAGMQFAGMLVFLTVREPALRSDETVGVEHEKQNALQHFAEGFRHIRHHPKLRKIVFLTLSTLPFSFVLVYIFQPYFAVAGVAPQWYGVAVALASLGTTAGKLWAYKFERWFGVEAGTLLATMLPGIAWFMMALVFDPVFSFVLYIATDAIGNMRDPILADYSNRHISSKNRATVISIIYLLESLYSMIARPLVGVLADIDLRYAFVAMGSVIILGAIFFRITKDDAESVVD